MQNILMIHMESWDGRMLGVQGGHPALKDNTPNIEKLAQRGTSFSNAYCTNPISCPSRANMLSGTYTHQCESWNNFKGLESGMWTYCRGLRKSHDSFILGKHDDFVTGHHSVMNRVADFLEPLNTSNRPVMDFDGAQSYNVSDNHESRCHTGDWDMFDNAADFIKNKATSKNEEKPFFLCLNPGLVHAAFHTNQYWYEKIDPKLVDIPKIDQTNHPANEYQKKSKGWRYGLEDDTVKEVRRIYFAMCAEADAMVGELLNTLKESGLEDKTTVIFSSDHGELALEHQQYYKMSQFEGSVRIPLIIAGPDIKENQIIETPVSLIDIAPTICELSDMPMRESFSGESLLPMARGETKHSRGYVLATYCGLTSNTMSHMYRKGDYKLIVYEGYSPRLFNLKNDPDELNDLALTDLKTLNSMETELNKIVDRPETLKNWNDYRRHNFAQFQRQAKRGLYLDNGYSLRKNPSSDYREIMNNSFTGWDDEDEARVNTWLQKN